jgi:hypothetical protein
MTTSVFTSTFSSLVDKAAKYYKYICTFSKRFHSATIFKVLIISVVLLLIIIISWFTKVATSLYIITKKNKILIQDVSLHLLISQNLEVRKL